MNKIVKNIKLLLLNAREQQLIFDLCKIKVKTVSSGEKVYFAFGSFYIYCTNSFLIREVTINLFPETFSGKSLTYNFHFMKYEKLSQKRQKSIFTNLTTIQNCLRKSVLL